MPKTPVDECPAGPAVDAAVAEALGHKVVLHYGQLMVKTPDGLHADPEPYSTDIAVAWEALEHLFQLNSLQDIHLEHLEHTGWGISTCYNKVEGGWDGWVYAETAPLAICRAFLKVNGIEYIEVLE